MPSSTGHLARAVPGLAAAVCATALLCAGGPAAAAVTPPAPAAPAAAQAPTAPVTALPSAPLRRAASGLRIATRSTPQAAPGTSRSTPSAGLSSGPTSSATLAAGCLPPVASAPALSQWEVSFCGPWPDPAKVAYQRAVDTWAAKLPSAVPIRVQATWVSLGDPGLLGRTGPADFFYDSTNASGLSYPVSLLEAATGQEQNNGDPDMLAEFNSNPSGGWYFGPDLPGTMNDFTSVALHELAHGLGLLGTVDRDGGGTTRFGLDLNGDGLPDGRYPDGYDSFVRNGSDPVLSYGSGSARLAAAVVGGNLRWGGPHATAANGGTPKLYAPTGYQAGSSYSHLDEATYPNAPDSLMTPVLPTGQTSRAVGPLTVGLLLDLGYPDPADLKYVDSLYVDLLGRHADRGGLYSHVGELTRHEASRRDVAYQLATSTEYLNTVVTTFYRNVLGREPDAAGRDGWVRAIQGGTPVATVGASFYASQENLNKAQTDIGAPFQPGADKWVESLYRALLARSSEPDDSAGRQYWVARSGDRQQVTTSFYGSTETLRKRVDDLYRRLLGRPAEPAGLDTWVPVVARDGDLALAATLATSQEYYARAQSR